MIDTGKTAAYLDGLCGAAYPEIFAYAAARGIPVLRRQTAQLLRLLVTMKKPERLLEVGTAIGYSGCILLSACSGRLDTIEKDEEFRREAAKNFQAYGFSGRVTQLAGDATEAIAGLTGKYDFIFLDGPKAQYAVQLPYLVNLLAPGGVMVADNVLFRGFVPGEADAAKKRGLTDRIREFLDALTGDKRLITCVLPTDDGVSVSYKQEETGE